MQSVEWAFLVDALTDPVLACGADGRLLAVNRAAATVLAWERPALVGQPLERIIPRRLQRIGGQPVHQHLFTRAAVLADRVVRGPVVRRDGVELEVEMALATAVSPAGEPLLVATLRRRQESVVAAESGAVEGSDAAAVAESHRRVFGSAPIGILHFDARGIITACNPMLLHILGTTRQLLVGVDLTTLPDPRIVDCIRTALAGRRALFEGDYRTVTSGKVTPLRVEYAPIFASDGTVSGGVGLVTDITERVQAEQALRRSEASFRALTESAPDAIAVHRDGLFTYANTALLRMLGLQQARELLGAPVHSILHPEARCTYARYLEQVFVTRAPAAPRELLLLRRDGTAVVTEVAALPIHFDSQPAVLMLARDITERKRIEARLAQADRMASLGTLAAGVAHEINTPLAYVGTSLELAVQEVTALAGPSWETRWARLASLLQNAQEGTERVRLLVRDLRTFSRGDEEPRRWVDVEDALERALGLVANELRHRARLEKDYGAVPRIWANGSRLGQVFVNLLMNAAQAIPEGDAARHAVRVRTRVGEDGRVAVEVSDTGAGIPPEVLGRIFEPFWTSKPVGVGTGLGLSICHGIVVGLGGEIVVESQPGAGSTFRVLLPVGEAPPQAEAPTPAPASAPVADRPRLLLVDDSARFAWTLRFALQDRYEVVTTSSGRDALRLLQEDDAFALILCDVMMPDVTGMDVYEELMRTRPGLQERIVFMTGGAFTARAAAFLQRVPNPRLDKPFRPEAVDGLFAQVRRADA